MIPSVLIHLAILAAAIGIYLYLRGLTGVLLGALVALVGVQAVQVWRRERQLKARRREREAPGPGGEDERKGS